MELINKAKLYERAASLESQALSYVSKLLERDGGDPSIEWRIWSAILTERTAFKHDIMDAQSLNIVHCCDCKYYGRADKKLFYRGADCLNNHIRTIVADRDYCSRAERRTDDQN